jgi:hypothetical protein
MYVYHILRGCLWNYFPYPVPIPLFLMGITFIHPGWYVKIGAHGL